MAEHEIAVNEVSNEQVMEEAGSSSAGIHHAAEATKPSEIAQMFAKYKALGHKRIDCSKNKVENKEATENANGPKQVFVMSDNAVRENTLERFCKSVTRNDIVKLNGQVDPGSAVCTIRASALIEHCFNPEPKVVELYGFGADEPIS
ncbi:hypothetical protein FQA39_LY01449 [Lamprigera yunnana]|nr:hypothetical protein FQA39_LY01449 [Lamprigera yunnana]